MVVHVCFIIYNRTVWIYIIISLANYTIIIIITTIKKNIYNRIKTKQKNWDLYKGSDSRSITTYVVRLDVTFEFFYPHIPSSINIEKIRWQWKQKQNKNLRDIVNKSGSDKVSVTILHHWCKLRLGRQLLSSHPNW